MYRISIRLFLDFTGDEITKRKVLDFKKMLVESKSPKTVNARLTAVNEFLQRNKMDDLRIKLLKIQHKHFVLNVPNDEEYEKLLKYFLEEKKYKLYWIVRFIAGTGTNTNGIESFWAILKRGILGIYHHVSVKYLQNYVNEFCFRQNNGTSSFDKLLQQGVFAA